MKINLFDLWQQEKKFLRAKILGGNISLSFTGTVARCSSIELVLSRPPDELSISLFCCTYKIFKPSEKILRQMLGIYILKLFKLPLTVEHNALFTNYEKLP